MKNRYKTIMIKVILLALFGILPSFLPVYYLRLVMLALIFGIFAISLDLLLGYTGLPSLGHALFFGTGAYMAGFMNIYVSQSFGITLFAGVICSGVAAAVSAPLILRTRGVYFLLITLVLGQVVWALFYSWRSVTGGDEGLRGISSPHINHIVWDLSVVSNYYYVVLIVFIVAVILMYFIVNSPFGRALIGIRESEIRMQALGYNTWLYKYVACIIAGLFAGVAGVLFVYYGNFISPWVLSIELSGEAMLMVIMGGEGTLIGPLLGAAIVVVLKYVVSMFTSRWLMVLGAVFIIVIISARKGIYSLILRLLWRAVSHETISS